jgi:hypothetical protein
MAGCSSSAAAWVAVADLPELLMGLSARTWIAHALAVDGVPHLT